MPSGLVLTAPQDPPELPALAGAVQAIGGPAEAVRLFPQAGIAHRGNLGVFARVAPPGRPLWTGT